MNSIDNFMNTKFEAEYCITENLLLSFSNCHHVPFIHKDGFVDLVKIFEVRNKTNSLSMGEMILDGIDPFEDLSDLYE